MKIASMDDYRRLARRRLPGFLFDYIDGGSYGEDTLRRNTEDFAKVLLRQRVLRDVATLDTSTTLFGQAMSMPIVLAPIGLAGINARRGEVQAIRAATRMGVPFTLSTLSVCAIAEVGAASLVAPWLQLYMIKDRGFMQDFLAEGQNQGARVLLLTVDLPVPGVRYRDVRSGLSQPPDFATKLRRVWEGVRHPGWSWDVALHGRPMVLGNLAPVMGCNARLDAFWAWVGQNFDASITWDDIFWIRERWSGPIVLKGLLDPEDARRAVDVGADGIVVSNHGGRQLDGALSSIAALPAVVDAVAGRLPVLMDGGVRSGLDVARAVALGARAVMIGRPWVWALAARGEAGVAQMLTALHAELKVAMALTGAPRLAELNRVDSLVAR